MFSFLKKTVPDAPAEKPGTGWIARLKSGLARTGSQLTGLFGRGGKIDDDLYEELETILITADVGMDATHALLADLRRYVKEHRLSEAAQLKEALGHCLLKLLKPLAQPLLAQDQTKTHKPFVIMLCGVNGAGKTTSIIQSAQARKIDVVLADTAGRLATQAHLMEEIKKVKRVIAKAMPATPDSPAAPHEVLLVLDANTGQNALSQVKAFDQALGVTGLVLTKLDGTAKGGVIAAIAHSHHHRAHPIPVRFIGVGEGLDDLRPFVAEDFVAALLGLDE
jgi:fused signal recognition particle receptor